MSAVSIAFPELAIVIIVGVRFAPNDFPHLQGLSTLAFCF